MKRRTLSLLVSLCLVLGLLPAGAFAQDTIQYVALGDSITTGYGLTDAENDGFAALVAQEQGYVLDNLAKDGATSDKLLNQLSEDETSTAVENADLITITIGGNDLMGALYEFLANEYNDKNSISITAEDVQSVLAGEKNEPIGQTEMLTFAAGVITNFAESTAAKTALANFGGNLSSIIAAIRAVNSDVTIIVANQYNPYRYLASEVDSIPGAALTQYPTMLKNVADAFDAGLTQLNGAINQGEAMGMYSVADVYEAFNGAAENPCNASITIALPPTINLDFHPNAYGHELIAEVINSLLAEIGGSGGEEQPEPQVE